MLNSSYFVGLSFVVYAKLINIPLHPLPQLYISAIVCSLTKPSSLINISILCITAMQYSPQCVLSICRNKRLVAVKTLVNISSFYLTKCTHSYLVISLNLLYCVCHIIHHLCYSCIVCPSLCRAIFVIFPLSNVS